MARSRILTLCLLVYRHLEGTLEGFKQGKKIPDGAARPLLEILKWLRF